MEKPVNLEKIKTFLIVVLFLTTILLLSFFWKNINLEGLPSAIRSMGETTPLEVHSIQQVLVPDTVEINFGSGTYTDPIGHENEIWTVLVSELTQICEGETVLMEEITPEQYEQVMEFRSVQAKLAYSIPFQEFCLRYQIKRHQSMAGIQSINSMAFSTGSPESFLLVDETTGKYYRLVADQGLQTLGTVIDGIEASGFTPFYEASTFFGVENRTRMPVAVQTNLSPIDYQLEFSPEDGDQIRALAESFFGRNFDFIRKITESNGNVVYLYGYGQKLFSLSQNAILQYKEELEAASGSEQDFFQSLEIALQYISIHGPTMGGESSPLALNLNQATRIKQNEKSGYRFTFGLELDGDTVFYEEGAPMILEIIGEQVVYFSRDLFVLDQAAMNQNSVQEEREAYSIANVMATNYRWISAVLVQEKKMDQKAALNASFESIAEKVTQVRIGYLKTQQDQDEGDDEVLTLVPAWAVTIDGIRFYFDIDDAENMGYTVI